MNNKADFFQKKMANSRSFTRRKKTSHIRVWIIVIVILLLSGFAAWKLFWAPANLNNYEDESINTTDFSLGEQIYLQGEIKGNGDISTHTHTIEDVNYGVIKIKSDSINLSDYAGFVELTGIVEKFYQGNPIVKVLSLSGTLAGTGDVDMNIDSYENGGVYLQGAGIHFLPSFFVEYVLLNEGENGEIHIQNIETGKEIVLNYFRCNPSDPNKNCKGLNETFANNNAQSFVTSEGDIYYKMSETQSRFVSNGNRWGIFIHDVSDDVVFDLKDLIKFANEKNINEWIKSRGINICQGSGEKLKKITNSEINLKQEGLIVTVSGDGTEKQMTCQILVDFALPEKGKLQSLTIGDAVVIPNETGSTEEIKSEMIVETPISATTFDTNVPQFPVREEGKDYTSTRGGYVLTFPSPNISFVVSQVKENFGRSDISCSHVINVIKYSEKDNLEISPSIRIYECSGTVVDSRDPERIIVYPRIGKLFIVQMNDGAWKDFSMNLKFEELKNE